MVLIACAMLYLAEAPQLQEALATFDAGGTTRVLSAAAITQETLRVHPPVGAQPRVVAGCGNCPIHVPRYGRESSYSSSSDGHDVEANGVLHTTSCPRDFTLGVG